MTLRVAASAGASSLATVYSIGLDKSRRIGAAPLELLGAR
jgi:hypothetical protein